MPGAVEFVRAQLRGRLRREARDLLRELPIARRRLAVPMARRLRPSFLLVGAQKSGTTSLWDWIAQHPDVRAPVWKEPRYFDRRYGAGLGWYLAQFPEDDGSGAVTGEATTGYLFHPHAARRIAETLPDARIVAVVRNPIDRAISHYQHERRKGSELRSMAEACDADLRSVPLEEERMRRDPSYRSRIHATESYLSRGMYAPQLERYLEHFGPDRVRVLKFEDFFADPELPFQELLRFLGLRPFEGVALRKLNVGGYQQRQEPGVDRDALRALFAPHNARLEALVGLDLSDWT